MDKVQLIGEQLQRMFIWEQDDIILWAEVDRVSEKAIEREAVVIKEEGSGVVTGIWQDTEGFLVEFGGQLRVEGVAADDEFITLLFDRLEFDNPGIWQKVSPDLGAYPKALHSQHESLCIG
jgi:hypothetical protein